MVGKSISSVFYDCELCEYYESCRYEDDTDACPVWKEIERMISPSEPMHDIVSRYEREDLCND